MSSAWAGASDSGCSVGLADLSFGFFFTSLCGAIP